MYYKIIDGQEVFNNGTSLKINGRWVSNPTPEMYEAEGWMPYTPPPFVPQPQDEPDYEQVVEAVKKMFSTDTEEMSDEEALEVAALFETWASKLNPTDPSQPGQEVVAGERLWYDGELWKVLQPHRVMQSWNPRDAVSLFVRVSIEAWPAWVPPVGSTDAYAKDAQVTHNDQHWISEIDGNVWEPGVYGWRTA